VRRAWHFFGNADHIIENAYALLLLPRIGSLVNGDAELLVSVNQLKKSGFLSVHLFIFLGPKS
jgi:hypothetical protein